MRHIHSHRRGQKLFWVEITGLEPEMKKKKNSLGGSRLVFPSRALSFRSHFIVFLVLATFEYIHFHLIYYIWSLVFLVSYLNAEQLFIQWYSIRIPAFNSSNTPLEWIKQIPFLNTCTHFVIMLISAHLWVENVFFSFLSAFKTNVLMCSSIGIIVPASCCHCLKFLLM